MIIWNFFFYYNNGDIIVYFFLIGGFGLLGDCWIVGFDGGFCGLFRNLNVERVFCNDK